MADNVTLPGTGEIVATDDVGGAQYQLIKLVDSTVNSTTPIGTQLNPLPIAAYGELIESMEAMRMAIQALTRTVGLVQPDTAARMRVAIDAISPNLAITTVSVVSTVSTVTNQTQMGGYSAVEQIPALIRMSADSLRRNITVS